MASKSSERSTSIVKTPLRKRSLAVAAAVAASAVIAALLLVPSQGQGSESSPAIAEDNQLAQDVVLPVLSESAYATLITPAGEDWWKLVTSVAGTLRMGAAPVVPADAQWYASFRAPGVPSGEGTDPTNEGILIGFPSEAAAKTWAAPAGCNCISLARGTIVAVIANSNRDIEGIDISRAMAIAPEDATPATGIWTRRIGDEWADYKASSPYPDAVQQMSDSLGFTPDTVWTATSTTAEGPWRGELEGLDGSADRTLFASRFAETVEVECVEGTSVCETVDPGYSFLSEDVWLVDREKEYTWGNQAVWPEITPATLADDTLFAIGILAPVFRGNIYRDDVAEQIAVAYWREIYSSDEMVLTVTLTES